MMPSPGKLAKHEGIIIFEVDQWDDATGHTTVWDSIILVLEQPEQKKKNYDINPRCYSISIE